MKIKFLIVSTFLTVAMSVHSADSFTGTYSYVDGTDHDECPGYTLNVNKDSQGDWSFFGGTGMGAIGPFKNTFYFTDLNRGNITSGQYVYNTSATANKLVRNVKFVDAGLLQIEEEIVFTLNKSKATLEYRLIKNRPTSNQWRHPSFKCIYSKD